MSDPLLSYEQMDQNNALSWLYQPSSCAMLQLRRFWIGESSPAYDHFIKRLGRSLRVQREAAGYSQESFADKIGMHRTYYSAIERGEKNLQIDTLHRICDGLKMRMSDVLKDADA